ncbi:acyltransferase family protein [Polynucleobacter sp. 15G-AUS-farblos]|uniref:acyltransferase family protein n=1 Tax=Polynucleobacter sp. 15G-AUS-farblos TaxID=2689094 RepID=UPI001C0AE48D|nr:acyltransferase family protein [Polynucleobacter sp. 15G-AUS-farblos]MBU3583489.1 acyltransferase family protein [Polynucleobacter sp. 15G-AUS-farblos]
MTYFGAPNRDVFLDIAKGMAIILVVLGHVIQGSSANFDDLLGFKMIYSFHMPLFIFLSGAVAAIAFDPMLVNAGLEHTFKDAYARVKKALIRLILPFIAWCVLNQLIYNQAESVINALVLAFRRPDTALWFLLAIFYCIVLTSLFQIFFGILLKIVKIFKIFRRSSEKIISGEMIQFALMIFIWWMIKDRTPYGGGLALLKPYFIYYVLGMGFYRYTRGNYSNWYSVLASAIFLLLSPFWLRTAEFQYAGVIVLPQAALYMYASLVAISGAFMMLGMAKLISSSELGPIKHFLILSGQLSLGIYALHYFFLAYSPKVIAPLFASIAISYVLNKIPVVRTIFLGESYSHKLARIK